jgi:hypothetical protein
MKHIIQGILASVLLTAGSVSNASVLLLVDLTVENTISISATNGEAAASISGSDNIGFYLANFFTAEQFVFSDELVSGDLTSAQNTSDGNPSMFVGMWGNFGLNVFSYTDDAESIFTVGETAFSGEASWTINAADYLTAVNGNSSGNVYFGADADNDIPSATLLGTWQILSNTPSVPVSAPSALLLIGLGIFGVHLARRKQT